MTDEPTLPTPPPEGARCAIHPDQPAARTCVRCGNYMCSACTSAGSTGLCLTCASRVGSSGKFAFSREHFTIDGLLNLSLSRWKQHWQVLTLGFGAALIFAYGISLGGEWVFERIADAAGPASALHSPLHPARVAFQVAVTLLHLIVQLAVLSVCLDVLEGEKPNPQRALERLRRLPDVILQTLVMYVALAVDIGLHYWLFLALGGMSAWTTALLSVFGIWLLLSPLRIYAGLGVMFSSLALLVDPQANALSAFAVSWRAVSGHRWQAFGVSLACALIIGVGVVACCVGVLVTLPIATLLYCSLFLALNNRETHAPALPHEGWHV
jgi:uncharacterized membrane protein